MKIGILTFSRTQNYGAVLQCYALQQTLKEIGCSVKVINYKQMFIEKYNNFFCPIWFLDSCSKLSTFVWFIVSIPKRYRLYRTFKKFRTRYLDETVECDKENIPSDFDAYIIGSDQLWTPLHTGGLDTVYMGDFYHGKGIIYSYAISSNSQSISNVEDLDISEYLKNFKTLSFREPNIAETINKIYGATTRVDIDPTLLASTSVWDSLINKEWSSKNYVAMYEVRKIPGNPDFLKIKANKLADSLGVKLLDLSTRKYSPEDFVSIIKYSKAFITTSFHGTVFSIIFNRPLLVYRLNDSHDGRSEELLRSLDLCSCIYDVNDPPLIREIDYSIVNEKLKYLRKKSMEYLTNIRQ